MLIGNYSVLNKMIGRAYAGTTLSDTRANFNKSSGNRNIYLGFNSGSSVPYNYLPPYSWIILFKSQYLLQQMSTNVFSSAITTASVTGNFYLSSTLSGQTILSAYGLTIASGVSTTVFLSATITTYSVLSPENLTNNIWNSTASNFNSGGTMGSMLNKSTDIDKNIKVILGLSL